MELEGKGVGMVVVNMIVRWFVEKVVVVVNNGKLDMKDGMPYKNELQLRKNPK